MFGLIFAMALSTSFVGPQTALQNGCTQADCCVSCTCDTCCTGGGCADGCGCCCTSAGSCCEAEAKAAPVAQKTSGCEKAQDACRMCK